MDKVKAGFLGSQNKELFSMKSLQKSGTTVLDRVIDSHPNFKFDTKPTLIEVLDMVGRDLFVTRKVNQQGTVSTYTYTFFTHTYPFLIHTYFF